VKKHRRPRIDTSRIGPNDQVIVVSPVLTGRPMLAAAVEVKCELCGTPSWLSVSNQQLAILSKCVCIDCTIVLVRERGLPEGVRVSPGSRQDLRAIGLTDAQIDSSLGEIAEGIVTDRLRLRTLPELADLFTCDIRRRKSS
jgi:hypothetical protein